MTKDSGLIINIQQPKPFQALVYRGSFVCPSASSISGISAWYSFDIIHEYLPYYPSRPSRNCLKNRTIIFEEMIYWGEVQFDHIGLFTTGGIFFGA